MIFRFTDSRGVNVRTPMMETGRWMDRNPEERAWQAPVREIDAYRQYAPKSNNSIHKEWDQKVMLLAMIYAFFPKTSDRYKTGVLIHYSKRKNKQQNMVCRRAAGQGTGQK